MAELNEFVQDFLAECREGLDLLDTEMVELERNPDDRPRLDRIFRALHTIKGNCGFLEFERLGALAHAGETLLARMRDRQVAFSREVADQLLQLIDAVRACVQQIAASGQEGPNDYSALRESLLKLASFGATPAADSEMEKTSVTPLPQAAAKPSENKPETPRSPEQTPRDQTEKETSRVVRKGEGVVVSPPSAYATRQKPTAAPPTTAPPLVPSPRAPVPSSPAASPKPLPSSDSSHGSSELSVSSIRIQVELLERLMNLIGELVLTRNQLLQRVVLLSDPTTSLITQRLNSITTELQEEFMRTRMVRIGTIWQRFPRVVRDTARQCGKDVRLVTEGDNTELDRSLVEAISEPLVHMIRNAIDHGIEVPHQRYAKGKPKQGTLTLRAYHEGGQVHIEVHDDGAGIDLEKVRQKVVQAGLVSEQESLVMDKAELQNSIFLPGFTTAAAISHLSGRGMGMDVVKTRIEQAGGTVQVESVAEQGTTVRLTVPLTMAIIPALIVRCAGHQYAVPQVSLSELLLLTADEARQRIDVFQNARVLRLRGRLVPLIRLREVLRAESLNEPPEEVCVLVLRTVNRTFGLIVDAVTNNEEIVVKPLVPLLQGLPVYAGSTLLGDGTLALILDVLGLARHAGVLERAATVAEDELEASAESTLVDLSSGLLLCEACGGHRVAFSVSSVRRLEEFSAIELERAAHQTVVQYRDDVLPVLDIAALLYSESATSRASEADTWPVVICRTPSGDVACRVVRVLDIAAAPQKILPSQNAGISGSAIIDRQMTDLLDAERLLTLAQTVRPSAGVVHMDETLPRI